MKTRSTAGPLARCVAFAIPTVVLVIASCSKQESADADGAAAPELQTAFRLRTDFDVPLNADEGWAGAQNESTTVATEQPFRLRFELLRRTEVFAAQEYQLQYRRNNGEWSNVQVAEFPYSEVEELTPRVSIISTLAFANGASTTDLLNGTQADFAGGAGVSLAQKTPVAPEAAGQTEWEWALVVRRYADGAVTNDTGDRFEFRMTDSVGQPVETSHYAALTVTVPPRLLAGTFVETPGRIGPWQSANGDLYFIMEPAESFNLPMMVKSSDGGTTWREVGGENRPATGDLEGVASVLSGDTVHIVHQISEEVLYHAFLTSDHPTRPDTWAIRDERIARPPGEPPVQAVSIAARADGSVVAFYAGPEKIRMRSRTPVGGWTDVTVIDDSVAPNLSGPQAVIGQDDQVHLAYTGSDGTAWYRRILPDGAMTPRVAIASDLGTTEEDSGSILPLVLLPGTNTVVVIYRSEKGELWERRVLDDEALTEPVRITERRVAQNAVDSDQTGADAIADGSAVHVLFIEEDSGSIFHTRSLTDGSWSPATLAVDGIRGQWVRGTAITQGDGGRRYGYVYDAGSNGGSGANWFSDLPLVSD